MTSYPHILAAFYGSPWALLPQKWEEIRAFLHAKAGGLEAADPAAFSRQKAPAQVIGRTALVPIQGVIAQRVGLLEQASGGVGADQIGATIDSLVADRGVRSIVLAFDSPGGSVYGIPELAAKIRAAAKEKRVVAVADSIAASAAYWLAAQAGEVVVTPGGQVGSIGVIAAHTDVSKAEEMLGLKTTLVTSSPYKGETMPEQPLSEEARAELQGKVDHYHGLFVADVAKGRGVSEATVNKGFGQGRMLTPAAAKEAGMVDRIATLDRVLSDLGAVASAPTAQAAAARARAVEVE